MYFDNQSHGGRLFVAMKAIKVFKMNLDDKIELEELQTKALVQLDQR
jgi:hypothetical protein